MQWLSAMMAGLLLFYLVELLGLVREALAAGGGA